MQRRNPLFIKSEFSHGRARRLFYASPVTSQSFIHQVRILSCEMFSIKKTGSVFCGVAILYSSSQNSLREWLIWKKFIIMILRRNPLFIKSEFSLSYFGLLVFLYFLYLVAILYSSSQNSLYWLTFIYNRWKRGVSSQSFIHQVRILSRDSPIKAVLDGFYVAILYSSSQNSLSMTISWRPPISLLSITSQSFIHQVRILSGWQHPRWCRLRLCNRRRNPLFIKSEFSL